MKTILYALFFIMVVIALSIMSCNKDDNPDNQADPWTLVLEENIGPEGGTLGDSTFNLEIPAGVFSSSTMLSLYSSSQQLFKIGQISLFYEIRGFPEEFEGTLPLRIQRTGEIENEFYIAIGTRKFARSYGDTVYALNYLPATDSGGYVQSEIRVQKPGSANRGGGDIPVFDQISDGSVSVGVVTARMTIVSSKNNFKVIYEFPTIPEAKAVMLGEALETALAKYQSMYFPKMEYLDNKYPIQVTYRPYYASPLGEKFGDNEDDYGSYSTPTTGRNVNPSFDFNYKILQAARDISIATGHECFHMVQSCYNTGSELKNWLTEATATYVEEFFVQGGIPPGTPYIPHVFSSHYVRSFLGIEAGASWIDPMSQKQKPSSSHGYGTALVIKYFCSLPGHENALPLMIMALDEDVHPVEAVLSSLGPDADPVNMWENCMNDFVMRRVYPIMQDNFVQGELFSNTDHGRTLTLEAVSKPYQTLTYALPDLSASFTRVNLTGDFTSDQKLGVFYTTTGDMAKIKSYTYYFKVKAGNGQRLEENPSFGTSLKALKDNGYSILIMTLNERHVDPYTEKTDITIHVGLKGPAAETNNASNVTATTATLNGKINPNEELTAGVFEYGLTTSYGSTVQLAQNQLNGYETIPVTAELTGLQPEKMYYFRLVASNQSGTATGQSRSFKTLKENTALPTATTVATTDATTWTVTLKGSVNPKGAQSYCEFEYGLTTAYGSQAPIFENPLNGDEPIDVHYEIENLQHSQTYHYRVVAYHQGFVDVVYGADMTFTTLPGVDVGQSYQGGVIFYVDRDWIHGMIAAPSDIGTAEWGCEGQDILGASGSDGMVNTIQIITYCPTPGIAAALCNDLSLNGYDDWFLPDYVDISFIYTNRAVISGLNANYYWTSEQGNANYAICLNMESGEYTVPMLKSSYQGVRPIRNFTASF